MTITTNDKLNVLKEDGSLEYRNVAELPVTAGQNGKSVLNGTVNPTTQGVDGDFYINTTTSFIFGPKAGGVWPAGVALVGPAGPAGPLDILTDVVITTPLVGQVLKFDGANWKNDTDATGGGGGTLDSLTDVVITTPVANQAIKYNGTNWVNTSQVIYLNSMIISQLEGASWAAPAALTEYGGNASFRDSTEELTKAATVRQSVGLQTAGVAGCRGGFQAEVGGTWYWLDGTLGTVTTGVDAATIPMNVANATQSPASFAVAASIRAATSPVNLRFAAFGGDGVASLQTRAPKLRVTGWVL